MGRAGSWWPQPEPGTARGEGLSEASCHGHGMSGPWGAGRALCTERLLCFQTQAEALPEEQALPLFWKLPQGPGDRVRAWTRRKVAPKPGILSLLGWARWWPERLTAFLPARPP